MTRGPKPYHLIMARVADDYLADGKWHDLDELVMLLMDQVPAGVAIRHAEEKRQTNVGKGTVRIKERSDEQLRHIGARDIVAEFLRATCYAIDRKLTTRNDSGPPRKIRKVRTHRALRGDPYRMARDQLTLRVARLEGVIVKMSKVMADHGLTEDAEKLTKGLKLGGPNA